MKLSVIAGTVAGLLALSAPAYAAPTVTVRVEGANQTLLERTTVTLGGGTAGPCPDGSAGAALDAATTGNWDRRPFVSTILGETHTFANSDYWAEWIDKGQGYEYGGGLCDDTLKEGDELLMLVDFTPAGESTVFPLDLDGVPANAKQGSDLALTVVEYHPGPPGGAPVRVAVPGATITGAGAPVTTDDDGRATVRLGTVGRTVLKATKAPAAPSAGEVVLVTAPNATPPTPAPPAAPDRAAPVAKLLGFTDQQVFKTGPRELKGSFTDGSGIKTVKLRLAKRAGGKCWYFSGKMEAFRRTGCGTEKYFAIGDRADWTYLLPQRLGKGRYVLDAVAIDGAGNRTPLARGTTRVVFTVR